MASCVKYIYLVVQWYSCKEVCVVLVGERVFRGLQCCLYTNTTTIPAEGLWQATD